MVVTVATHLPQQLGGDYIHTFRKLGVHEVDVLDVRTRDEAFSEDSLKKLSDAAVIIFMVQDHGESVLRFGVLRRHMRRRALSGGHLLEGLWADKALFFDRAPQLQEIADR